MATFSFILFIFCCNAIPCQTQEDPEIERSRQLYDLDLNSGVVFDLALRTFQESIYKFVSEDGVDFSIIIHLFAYFSLALFDSIAPYNRNAVGIIR